MTFQEALEMALNPPAILDAQANTNTTIRAALASQINANRIAIEELKAQEQERQDTHKRLEAYYLKAIKPLM